jgi:hypothetical protein
MNRRSRDVIRALKNNPKKVRPFVAKLSRPRYSLNMTFTYDIGIVDSAMNGLPEQMGKPYYFKARADVADYETAQAVAVTFPKSLRVKSNRATRLQGREWIHSGVIYLEVRLSPGKVNGGANETGLKRIRGFFAACAKQGIAVELDGCCGNSSKLTAQELGLC